MAFGLWGQLEDMPEWGKGGVVELIGRCKYILSLEVPDDSHKNLADILGLISQS